MGRLLPPPPSPAPRLRYYFIFDFDFFTFLFFYFFSFLFIFYFYFIFYYLALKIRMGYRSTRRPLRSFRGFPSYLCGNTVYNSVFRDYIFFWQLFFFCYATKNNQFFSFGCQRGRISNQKNSSALIDDYGNFCVFI